MEATVAIAMPQTGPAVEVQTANAEVQTVEPDTTIPWGVAQQAQVAQAAQLHRAAEAA